MQLLFFHYVKHRERKLRAEKKILEAKVKERTRELEIRKNEIEQQRDEISEKNLNITSSIKYARQIQKALLPPLRFSTGLSPIVLLSINQEILSAAIFTGLLNVMKK